MTLLEDVTVRWIAARWHHHGVALLVPTSSLHGDKLTIEYLVDVDSGVF